MPARDIIRQTLDSSDMILKRYIDDLNDADLLVRPAEGMNHIAWQLGHLIVAERTFVEDVKPGASPALPEGFEANHAKETHDSDDAKRFSTKSEYLALWDAQRAATKAALDALSDEDLEKPGPERWRRMVPSLGGLLNFAGGHTLMHVGQFVPVRRKLGKPIVI
jgi:hypothetical protein